MATVICTVGASAVFKLRNESFGKDKKNPLYLPKWIEWFGGMEQEYSLNPTRAKRKIDDVFLPTVLKTYGEYLDEMGPYTEWKDGDDIWRILPVEIGSTIRMIQRMRLEMNPNAVTIVLLGTDTPDGYLATRVLEHLFRTFGFNVEQYTVEGFQMKDLQAFKMEGIPNFIKKVNQTLVEQEHPMEFNITAGYKNFIPLVTHIASFFQLDMFYVFEDMVIHRDSILLIPNVPTFNRIIFDDNASIDQFQVIADIIDDVAENDFQRLEDVEQEVLERLEFAFYDLGDELPETLTTFIMKFFEMENDRVTMTIFGHLYRNLLQYQHEDD